MLERLEITNFILIDKIDIDFSKNFNCITGETGSGKSLILKAIDFLINGKYNSDYQKNTEKNTTVTAVFEIKSPDDELQDFLKENDISTEDDRLIFKRTIKSGGKLSSQIQDNSVTSKTFSILISKLIILNTQKSENTLLSGAKIHNILDNFSKTSDLLKKLNKERAEYRELKNKIDEYNQNQEKNRKERDYIEYVINEIESAKLKKGEDEELKNKLDIIKNSAKIKEYSYELNNIFSGSNSVAEQIGRSASLINKLLSYDNSLSVLQSSIENIKIEIDDIKYTVSDYYDKTSFSQGDENEIVDRLDLITKLKRKYGSTIEEVLSTLEEYKGKIEDCFDDEKIVQQTKRADLLYSSIKKQCDEIYKKRIESAKKFDENVTGILKNLLMPNAIFKTQITKSEDILTDDKVEFQVAVNKGSALQNVKNVASGGELSRIYLSILTQEKSSDDKLIVFDEIDAGMGGNTANYIAEYLCQISQNSQVLCVTHIANVAARADNQIVVRKNSKSNTTNINAENLDDEARIVEIARMLSGDTSSQIALGHARELLGR